MKSEIARERIGEVIRIDTVTSTQADFLATHVPITNIHIKKKMDSKTDKIMSEEEAYNKYVLNPDNKHQFIIVIGASGAGKSHLIRWFDARLEQSSPEEEVVLFVRRSDNSLKGTIKQLLEIPEVANIPNKDVYDRLVRATSTIDNKKLKDMIYQNFIVEIMNDENDEILTNNEKKRLIPLLQYEEFQNRLMKEDGAIDRINQKVAENSAGNTRDIQARFEADDFVVNVDFCDDMITNGAAKPARKMADSILADDEMPQKLANYMNTLVNRVVQTCAGLEPGDFEQVFVEIRKEIKRQGKNLTLLIEDVTAFTGVNVALLNVLTTEHTGMYEEQELCRISSIVGTTQDYYKINFADNHKDRVSNFFYIPNDTFGENPNSLFEFVGRYLNAMSLRQDVLIDWAQNGATMKEYPVHVGEESDKWDTIELQYGKKLSLYPFTKNAVINLYRCILQPDYRTPRYLLRDVIERAVRNYLFKKESFPEFTIERITDIQFSNIQVSSYIHQHVEDSQADRVERFVRVWGDASDTEYVENGIRYISGMPIDFFEDLNIPTFEGRQGQKKVGKDISEKVSNNNAANKKDLTDIAIQEVQVDPAMAKFLLGQRTLQIWLEGGELNVGANTAEVADITKARDEINKHFLATAINWQAEGVSLDNYNRVTNTRDFIGFERTKRNQRRAPLITLSADRETHDLMEAFLAYVTLGNGSWQFDNSATMVYKVQLWLEKWKRQFIDAMNNFDGKSVDYQDCAIATEMIREIMLGVFTGTKVEGIPTSNLMAKNLKKSTATSHSSDWNAIVTKLVNNDQKIKDTVTQYYNLIQGDKKSSMVFIRSTEFIADVRRIQKAKLKISDEQLMQIDPIVQRQEIRDIYEFVITRLPRVAEAEKNKANSILDMLKNYLDYEDCDEEEIEDLIEHIKDFYENASVALVNVHGDIQSLDSIKKDAKTISVALNETIKGLECQDYIDVLLMFSKDPLSKLERLLSLLQSVQKDVEYVARDVAKRKENIFLDNGGDASTRYKESRNYIETDENLVSDWKVK